MKQFLFQCLSPVISRRKSPSCPAGCEKTRPSLRWGSDTYRSRPTNGQAATFRSGTFAARSAGCEKTRPSLCWGSDTCKSPSRSAGCGSVAAASLALIDSVKSPFTQSTPLFLKGSEGFGERGKTSFPVKRGFPSLPSLQITVGRN